MNIQFGYYDLHKRFSKLSESGDALERLDAVIDWEMFRAALERIDRKERKSAAGRKPMDRVVMFKMLILQNLYGLSDEALEYQVSDRLTFMRFPRRSRTGRYRRIGRRTLRSGARRTQMGGMTVRTIGIERMRA